MNKDSDYQNCNSSSFLVIGTENASEVNKIYIYTLVLNFQSNFFIDAENASEINKIYINTLALNFQRICKFTKYFHATSRSLRSHVQFQYFVN